MSLDVKISVVPLIVVVAAIIFGYFFLKSRNDELKEDLIRSVRDSVAIKMNQEYDKLELQGHSLSDSMSSQATVAYIAHQSFIKQLFSDEAKKQEAKYQAILSTIPKVIKDELDHTGENVDNIAHIGVQIDSFDVMVEIGKNAEFKRGYLRLEKNANGKEFYHLHLFPEEIEVTEVRTKQHEDGKWYSYVEAKSKLTGQVFKTEQNIFPVIDSQSGIRFSPWIEGTITTNYKYSQAKIGLLTWRHGDTGDPLFKKYEVNVGELGLNLSGDVLINIISFRANF